MDAYPESKIILTTRDPVKWFNSVKNSIYQSRLLYKDPIVRLYLKFRGGTRQWRCAQKVSAGTYLVLHSKVVEYPPADESSALLQICLIRLRKGKRSRQPFSKNGSLKQRRLCPKRDFQCSRSRTVGDHFVNSWIASNRIRLFPTSTTPRQLKETSVHSEESQEYSSVQCRP